MTTHTAVTAPTQFVEAKGIRFAYRRFGRKAGAPLIFNQHFIGNLDNWDPAVLDGLANEREVVTFNNAGIASSTGEVPKTFAGMAKNAEAFIDALGLKNVDLLGFSIGGMVRSKSRSTVPNWFASSFWSEPPHVISTQEMARATSPRRRPRSSPLPTTRPRICGSRLCLPIRKKARRPVVPF
jgi:hypothetical protein